MPLVPPPLFTAVRLLERGWHPDLLLLQDDGWTPLHCAAKHRHLELVRQLLDAGATVDAPGKVRPQFHITCHQLAADRPIHSLLYHVNYEGVGGFDIWRQLKRQLRRELPLYYRNATADAGARV
jgi:hypothetical protein